MRNVEFGVWNVKNKTRNTEMEGMRREGDTETRGHGDTGIERKKDGVMGR
jgi:hypothetical protein